MSTTIIDLVNIIVDGNAFPFIPDAKKDYKRLVRRLIHRYDIPFRKESGKIVLNENQEVEFWDVFHQVYCQGRKQVII